MSRHRHRNLDRGVKSAIGTVTLRPRQSRHGRELSEVFYKQVRTVEENPTTHVLEVRWNRVRMSPEEIEQARLKVRRALAPTATHGQENKPKNMAPGSK